MGTLEDSMKANLYRVDCPAAQILGEYHLGLLSKDQCDEIRFHLKSCSHCKRELTELIKYMDSLKPDLETIPTSTSQLRVILGRLLEPRANMGVEAPSSLAYNGIRGEQDSSRIYKAGDWQIALEVQDDVELPGYKVIIGIVIGDLKKKWQAQLWHEEQKVATTVIDPAGNFRFEKLRPASYQIILSTAGQEIYIQSVEIC